MEEFFVPKKSKCARKTVIAFHLRMLDKSAAIVAFILDKRSWGVFVAYLLPELRPSQ